MRCTGVLLGMVFVLAIVGSASSRAGDLDPSELTPYMETLLTQQVNHEARFSRLAPWYLALEGQDSQPFIDSLTASQPLPWVLLVHYFQHSLPACTQKDLSLLDSLLDYFARASSFDTQWTSWQSKVSESPDDVLLHWLAREWLRLSPGGGH